MRTQTTKAWVAVVSVAIAGLSWTACDNDREVLAPGEKAVDEEPSLGHVSPSSKRIRITGGGRIDHPPGTAEQNTPESRTFQTFALTVGDENADGVPEGKLRFVDHTPENRVNGQPLKLRVASWTDLSHQTEGCLDGGMEATGVLVIENTGEEHPFRLLACDNGEPGRGLDSLRLDVLTEPVRTWRGVLTGGNLQAHPEGSETEPTTGELEITTQTTGSDLPEGYTVVIHGVTSLSIGPNNTVSTFLDAGDYTVELGDVPANCTVSGENPRTVSVIGGGTVSTTFEVSCVAVAEPTTSTLSITTSTTGDGQPAGYALSVTGPQFPEGASTTIGANDNVTVSDVAAGDYEITLGDVPANCTVSGANPRTVTVPGGGTGSTTFEVSCTAATSTITQTSDFELE